MTARQFSALADCAQFHPFGVMLDPNSCRPADLKTNKHAVLYRRSVSGKSCLMIHPRPILIRWADLANRAAAHAYTPPMTAAHDSSTPAIPAVPGAGGVVFDSVGRVLLVRYQGSGAWAFPKGHVEEGETFEQTAVREVQEETGIRARVAAPLQTTEYTNDRGEARQIHWFRMKVEAADTALEDTFAEGGFKDAGEALNLLSYPEDQHLLRAALAQLGG